MGDKSNIEWTNATWNPVTGCTKVSQGCKNCYAERDWARLSAPRPKPNKYIGRAFTDVATHPDDLDLPLRWTKPRRIFVNSMSDLFHEDVPDTFIAQVFAVMARAEQHTFQILTKRPERMRALMAAADAGEGAIGRALFGRKFPLPNAWLGVSVEDQATADQRIPQLLQTLAAVRWISAEPLLGPLNLSYYLGALAVVNEGRMQTTSLDWLVAGGESGPRARPSHPNWFRSLRDQCRAAGVPFFFKQWGEWVPAPWGTDWMTPDGRVGTNLGLEYDAIGITRAGKKAAGNLLDHRKWEEYPRP